MLTPELVRSCLDFAPDAMVIIDSSGQIHFANRQVSEMFGYPAADLVGGSIETLVPERLRGLHAEHRGEYNRNVRNRPMRSGLELLGMRHDGTEFPVEISLRPLEQGGEIMVAASIRDVTERKREEQSLKDARHDAERANRAKSGLLAMVSHDLRQPLQTLALLNGALRRMIRDEECLAVLREGELAVDAMSGLVSTLLDVRRLESGAFKPEITDFEIAPLFEQLRHDFSATVADKGLRLSIDAPTACAHSDVTLVTQILRNLLSNAIKYTQQGSVELRCESRARKLRFTVNDTGIGIAPDQLGLIFDDFFQIAGSPDGSDQGHGLGLTIVQRAAKLLGTEVTVESEVGKGSRFSFELPAGEPRA